MSLAPALKRELRRVGGRLPPARGLSQEQAAEKMGVCPKYLTRLEGGGVNVTIFECCEKLWRWSQVRRTGIIA